MTIIQYAVWLDTAPMEAKRVETALVELEPTEEAPIDTIANLPLPAPLPPVVAEQEQTTQDAAIGRDTCAVRWAWTKPRACCCRPGGTNENDHPVAGWPARGTRAAR